MRPPGLRFSIRSFMIAVALVTLLAAGGAQVVRCARTRADALRQVENYRYLLAEADRAIAEIEAGAADPEEQVLLASMPADRRGAWLAEVDAIRRHRLMVVASISRWQRLADHPWESRPVDLYRVD